jgi:hypothetical protein
MRSDFTRKQHVHATIAARLKEQREEFSRTAWEGPNTYFFWLASALKFHDIVDTRIAPMEKLILVDAQQWDGFFPDRFVLPFLERNGEFWGLPTDDQVAIDELERLRHCGASFFVVPWTSFWWLDAYPKFFRYLRGRYACTTDKSFCTIFSLMTEG